MALVKYNNQSIASITETGMTSGAMTLIKSQTASSSGTISFIHGTSDVVLDSTYPIYVFEWINMHPASDDQSFLFQGTTDGSNFNINVTNTSFTANHNEADDGTQLAYNAAYDSDNDTSFMVGGANVGMITIKEYVVIYIYLIHLLQLL